MKIGGELMLVRNPDDKLYGLRGMYLDKSRLTRIEAGLIIPIRTFSEKWYATVSALKYIWGKV